MEYIPQLYHYSWQHGRVTMLFIVFIGGLASGIMNRMIMRLKPIRERDQS